MKKVLSLFAVFFAFVFLISCGAKTGEETAAKAEAPKKVAIVYSTGGKGDKSFNDSAYRGLEKAKTELGIEVSEYEPKDPTVEAKNQLTEYAQTGEYALIIGVGFTMKDSLQAVAKEYPDQKFALIDDIAEGDNIASLLFKEQEGSFLTGAIAGLMTKTNVVGFVGGMESPVIYRFATGFIQGAKYVNPSVQVVSAYINGNNPFNDPVAGKQLTESLISNKADVIMHAAGGSGAGVFKAAQEHKVYAIGVDSDQDGEIEGTILTSMIKNVDVAVFNTIKAALDGTFTAGTTYFGIAEDGVGTSEFKFTKDIIGQEKIAKVQQLKQDIKDGKINVLDDTKGPLK